jgi:hypothetical protein
MFMSADTVPPKAYLTKICMVIPSFYPFVGGAERQVGMLARTLMGYGLYVSIITRRLKGTKRTENIDGINVIRLPDICYPLFFSPHLYFI